MEAGIVREVRGIARTSIGWSIALSVLLIVIGLCAVVVPFMAGVAVTGIVAWLILLGGVMHLWLAFHVRGTGAHIWEALIGLAYLWIGIYILMHPLAGLVGLTIVLAVYLLIKGVLELVLAAKTRPLPGSGLLLVDAILSIVLSGLIWWHLPSAATWAVGLLIGFGILFSGISRLVLSLAAKKALAG